MIYSLAGGSKSGKSLFAQRIACSMPAPHYYVATMRPHDAEDEARIAKHIRRARRLGFAPSSSRSGSRTSSPAATPAGTILLDSVTALLANEMFPPDGTADPDAPARVEADCWRWRASGRISSS
jgi:adenosylcobinamide kinase/adenosylcobinamide-phosphate guanylyltransferase